MAIQIINGFVAIKDQEPLGGMMSGEVALISAGVTSVSVGNQVFYRQASTLNTVYNGVEYVLILASDIIGKL
jgi:co-chaperonin GroES (HSP10)